MGSSVIGVTLTTPHNHSDHNHSEQSRNGGAHGA